MNKRPSGEILFDVATLYSCSKYQKVLKSDDINFKYEQAVKYYKNSEFNKALPLFNELIPIFKES